MTQGTLPVNVRDWGAAGNGGDYTAEINAALREARTKVVGGATALRTRPRPLYFPAGVYGYAIPTSTTGDGHYFHLVRDYDAYLGDGIQTSLVQVASSANGAVAAIAPQDPTQVTSFVRLENIAINGEGDTKPAVGVDIQAGSSWSLRWVDLNHFEQHTCRVFGRRDPNTGAKAPADATYNTFIGVRFIGGVVPCVLDGVPYVGPPSANGGDDSGTSNINYFLHCRFTESTSHGCHVVRGASNAFHACSFVNSEGDGFRCDWYVNALFGCVAENNGGYGVHFTDNEWCYDNLALQLQDGGSNTKGLIRDALDDNYWWAHRRGIHIGKNRHGTSAIGKNSLFRSIDGLLRWKDDAGRVFGLQDDPITISGQPQVVAGGRPIRL